MIGAALVILATLLGSIVSLSRPFYGLLIYISFSILKPEAIWGHALPSFNYSRVVAISLLLGWAMNGFGRWQLGRAKAIVAALFGFWIWVAVCTVFAPFPEIAFVRVEETAKIILPILVGLTVIETPRQLQQVTWVIVLTVGYVAYELNVSYFQGYNALEKKGFGSMDNNTACVFLVTGLGPAFFAGLNAKSWWAKATGLGIALLLVHAVLFSFSRGGMLSMGATGFAAFLLIRKRTIHYVMLILLVAICLRLAGPEVRNRFMMTFAPAEKRDESAESRIGLWATCWQMFLENPIFGIGPDHFPQLSWRYGWPQGKQAHTTWLQAACETGLPGFLFLVSFFLLAVFRLLPLAFKVPQGIDPWLQVQAQITLAALVGFAFSAQFVSLVGLEMPYYLVMLGAWALKFTTAEPPERILQTQWHANETSTSPAAVWV